MKKLFCGITAAVMTVCVSLSAMAATSNISVKNDVTGSKPVTYSYNTEKSEETVVSIKTLMTKLDDLKKQDSVVQSLIVTSESADNMPVSIKLRLSIPQLAASTAKPEAVKTPSPEEYSALSYYNVEVTDTDGNIIYSYTEEEETDDTETYKDIPIGIFNTDSSSESKILNITLSVNEELNKSQIKSNAEKLDWSIVSDTNADAVTATAAPSPDTVAEPTSTPVETAAPSVTEENNGVVTLAKGTYLCGKDIEPGRYTMTGSGKVQVYTSENVLKTTVSLSGADNIINLQNGERIEVEGDTKFTPYTAERPSATPSATSTPRPTATPRATSTPRPTATPSEVSSNSKTNPKTGDSSPITAVSLIGLTSLVLIAYITIKKKRED